MADLHSFVSSLYQFWCWHILIFIESEMANHAPSSSIWGFIWCVCCIFFIICIRRNSANITFGICHRTLFGVGVSRWGCLHQNPPWVWLCDSVVHWIERRDCDWKLGAADTYMEEHEQHYQLYEEEEAAAVGGDQWSWGNDWTLSATN